MHNYQKLLNAEELLLLDLLKCAVTVQIPQEFASCPEKVRKVYENAVHDCFLSEVFCGIDWEKLINLADKHCVLSLLHDLLVHIDAVPEALVYKSGERAKQTVLQNYRLLYMSSRIIQELEQHHIRVILLKGWQTAWLYPVPEVRKSGDIDILVAHPQEFLSAIALLEKQGCKKQDIQHANHHVELVSDKGISIEVHSRLAEPFDNKYTNDYLENIKSEYNAHLIHKNILGYPVTCTNDGYDAFYLLLHMLQHFLRAGFGVKLLCDWAVFWNRRIADQEKASFLRLITESRTQGFAQTITEICVQYFGLQRNNVAFMFENQKETKEDQRREKYACFMKDILEAEEFGHSNADRMVVLQNSGLRAYIREFHHQMRLNHPRLSKCIVLWPYLWVHTLVVFFVNNRKIRKTTAREIFKKANARSKLIEEMRLFKK